MKIHKYWTQMPHTQRRAGRVLAGFMGMMLVFSAISHALDAFTIAHVIVGAPSYGTLTHEVKLQGKTAAVTETAIVLPEGFPIRELYIREGVTIAEGDRIALLDIDAIERQLATAQAELKDTKLAASLDNVQAELPEPEDPLEQAERGLARARQDAEDAAEAARNLVARAESDLRFAQRERRRLYEEGDYTDAQIDEMQNEVNRLGYAVEDAVRAADESQKQAEREIEDAELALSEAERMLEKTAGEEAAENETRGITSSRHGITIEERQAAVDRLKSLHDVGGIVNAANGGMVTDVLIQPGDVTSSAGAFLISGMNESLFAAQATKEEISRIVQGDWVDVILAGQNDVLKATVSSVQAPETAEELYTVNAIIADSNITPGTVGILSTIKQTERAETLVPLSSLHTENSPDRGYVFILREQSTTLGTQMLVERLDVQIVDRGRNMAAVQAAFSPDDRIVTASSRYLEQLD